MDTDINTTTISKIADSGNRAKSTQEPTSFFRAHSLSNRGVVNEDGLKVVIKSTNLHKPNESIMHDVPEPTLFHRSTTIETALPEIATALNCPAGFDDGDHLDEAAAHNMDTKPDIPLATCGAFKKMSILLLGLAMTAVVSVTVGRALSRSRDVQSDSSSVLSPDSSLSFQSFVPIMSPQFFLQSSSTASSSLPFLAPSTAPSSMSSITASSSSSSPALSNVTAMTNTSSSQPVLAPSIAPLLMTNIIASPTTSSPSLFNVTAITTNDALWSSTCISSDQNYTSQAWQNASYPDLSFYILGDVPYSTFEEVVFINQLKDISFNVSAGSDSALFMVHVGDIQTASKCFESSYTLVSNIMKNYSSIPMLTLIGDNDWNDCPTPSIALSYYKKHFVGLENFWNSTNFIPSLVQRSCDLIENFVFFHSGVLFISVNTVAGAPIWIPENSKRHEQNSAWVNANFDRYLNASRAVIVFGHSTEAESLFQTIKNRTESLSLPIVYLHGNGHTWHIQQRVSGVDMPASFHAIQVDQGGKAPPVKVTIRGNTAEALAREFIEENASQFVLSGVFKLDRGNGLYTQAQLQSIANTANLTR